MHCRGVRGRSKTKNVRFSSNNLSACRSKPCKDNHASSSSDHKSFGANRRRSTGPGGEKPRPIKCKFYKSIGDESSVERREFEIWNGSLSADNGHERPGTFAISHSLYTP